jgi:hypothetical protein
MPLFQVGDPHAVAVTVVKKVCRRGENIMSQKIRSTVALFVLVLLFAGAASALPLASTPYEPSGFVAVAWDWLTSLAGRLGGYWEKAGSQMDPNGLNKEGSSMDPDGLHLAPCPNGTTCTQTGSLTAEGSQMDPDGVR